MDLKVRDQAKEELDIRKIVLLYFEMIRNSDLLNDSQNILTDD